MLRYLKSVVALPAMCDGYCGAPTSVAHALKCRKGARVSDQEAQ